MIIKRNGEEIILNTRSAALTKAGIPRSEWKVLDMTGDKFFEKSLTKQMKRSNLEKGVETTTQRGSGGKIIIGADEVITK